MRSPSSLASAAVTSACASANWVSPAMTKSVALSLVSGMSCATCAMRHCDGIEKSPLSSCRVPFSSANRLDLPAPLRPTRPTFSPGLIDTDALSSRTLALRLRLRFLRMIMQTMRCAETPRPNRKPDSTLPPRFARPACRLFNASTRDDGFPSIHVTAYVCAINKPHASICFIYTFFRHNHCPPEAQALQVFRQASQPKEHIMKLQFGKNQLVHEHSTTPKARFHGQ